MAWTSGQIAGIVVVSIIFIIIVALLIWFLLVNHRTSGGQTCTANSDCGSGYYCGGGGICVKGDSGETVGQTCTADHQCDYGLLCENGKCVTEVLLFPDNLNPSSSSDFATRVGASSGSNMSNRYHSNVGSLDEDYSSDYVDSESESGICGGSRRGSGCFSFRSKHIVSKVSGVRYYLNVTTSGSRWTSSPYMSSTFQTFDYDCSSGRLTSNGREIYVNSDGNLALSRSGSSRLHINRRSGGYVMQDRYGNVLSVLDERTELDALFQDPVHYPSSGSGGASPVMFKLY